MTTNIRTISFKTGPSLSGHGFPLPEGSDIPKMRGRKSLNLKIEIEYLTSALKTLSDIPCSFWACKGPRRVQHMVTCSKCYAMREITAVRATLVNAIELNSFDREE